MNTANDNIPLRVIYYPPMEKKNPKFQLVIHENPAYSKEILDKYALLLAECIEVQKDINLFFKEKGLGFVWGEIILGAVFISPSGKVTEFGDTKISMGFVRYGNERCSIKDVRGLTPSVPVPYQRLSFMTFIQTEKIKDVLWYFLIGLSTYYALTELIKIIF